MKARTKAKYSKEQQARINQAIEQIAEVGKGFKNKDMVDWPTVGKNCVYVAREALRPKCSECGAVK